MIVSVGWPGSGRTRNNLGPPEAPAHCPEPVPVPGPEIEFSVKNPESLCTLIPTHPKYMCMIPNCPDP